MKIRSDFVTNSSSSSFILGFKNEEELEEIFNLYRERIEELYKECKSEKYRVKKEEAIQECFEKNYDDAKSELMDEMLEKGSKWSEAYSYAYSDEAKDEILERAISNNDYDSYVINNHEIIISVNHGDGGNGEDGILEHSILPNFPNLIEKFSLH